MEYLATTPFSLNCFVSQSVLVTLLCLILFDPKDCSPPGSSVHGIFQARVLEWVAISSSKGSFRHRDLPHCRQTLYHLSHHSLKVKVKSLSRVRLFATPWTVAQQASPSVGFSRQEYWIGLPFPSPGDLPNLGI